MLPPHCNLTAVPPACLPPPRPALRRSATHATSISRCHVEDIFFFWWLPPPSLSLYLPHRAALFLPPLRTPSSCRHHFAQIALFFVVIIESCDAPDRCGPSALSCTLSFFVLPEISRRNHGLDHDTVKIVIALEMLLCYGFVCMFR
jgi:hypothetical protein